MTTDPGKFPMNPEPFEASAEPPKQGRGCFFYGCITAIVLAVLTLLAIAILVAQPPNRANQGVMVPDTWDHDWFAVNGVGLEQPDLEHVGPHRLSL